MSDDLRARVRAAISATANLRGLDGPDRTETATVPLDAATDAVMAVLAEEFPPPLIVDFGENTLSPDDPGRGGRLVTPEDLPDGKFDQLGAIHRFVRDRRQALGLNLPSDREG